MSSLVKTEIACGRAPRVRVVAVRPPLDDSERIDVEALEGVQEVSDGQLGKPCSLIKVFVNGLNPDQATIRGGRVASQVLAVLERSRGAGSVRLFGSFVLMSGSLATPFDTDGYSPANLKT